MNANDDVIEKLTESTVYQDYERAFSDATGLPMSLRPVNPGNCRCGASATKTLSARLMAQKSRSCAACLQTQQKLAAGGAPGALQRYVCAWT